MKHFAVRQRSMRKGDRGFTTPGLGDRVHQCLLAYNYSKRYNTPVTLHLHGQQNDKERKWRETFQFLLTMCFGSCFQKENGWGGHVHVFGKPNLTDLNGRSKRQRVQGDLSTSSVNGLW